MKTAAQLAELFAEVEDPNRAGAERTATLARRIRHFSQTKLILPAAEARDKRGTEQFDVVAACATRLLSELADFGFTGELLRDAAGVLSPRASGVLMGRDQDRQKFTRPYWGEASEENTVPPSFHIAHLPENIRANQDWELRMRLMVQFKSRSLSGALYRMGEPTETPPAGFHEMQHMEQVGLITLAASKLCKPVVDAFEA